MEATYHEHLKRPSQNHHPFLVEDFTVMSGELTVRIDEKLNVLKTGDTLHILVYKVQSMWNNSGRKSIVNWRVQPAMDTDYLLEISTGLANDGKTNEDGMPNILQIALMANNYSTVFRLSSPPLLVQETLFLHTAFAYVFGYRPDYKKHLD